MSVLAPGTVPPSYYLDWKATLSTVATAGLVFDYYGPTDFKFAAVVPGSNQVVIGHRTAKGWFIDRTVSVTLAAGADYQLGLTLKGTTVSVTLGGQVVAGYVYNALVTDGALGLFSRDGGASFDGATVKAYGL